MGTPTSTATSNVGVAAEKQLAVGRLIGQLRDQVMQYKEVAEEDLAVVRQSWGDNESDTTRLAIAKLEENIETFQEFIPKATDVEERAVAIRDRVIQT